MLHLPEIPFAGCWAFSWTSDIADIATLWEWLMGTRDIRSEDLMTSVCSHCRCVSLLPTKKWTRRKLNDFYVRRQLFQLLLKIPWMTLVPKPHPLFASLCSSCPARYAGATADWHTHTNTHTHNQKIELTWFPGGFAQNQHAREKRWEKGLNWRWLKIAQPPLCSCRDAIFRCLWFQADRPRVFWPTMRHPNFALR